MVPDEASPTRHGLVESGPADLHPRTPFVLREAG